jgi:multicomponent K+:H+ antiporter subunit A
MVLDLPFLTSGYHHFHWPVVGDFELSSAMAFDWVVFMTVVGGVMLALAQLSKLSVKRRTGSRSTMEPMDVDPRDSPGGRGTSACQTPPSPRLAPQRP